MKLSQALAAGKNISDEELRNLALPRYGCPAALLDRPRDLAEWLQAHPQCDVEVVEAVLPVGGKTLRPEQSPFSKAVRRAYGGKCAVTGESCPAVLEAAHLPGRDHKRGHNRARDGILLRADLHKLMDEDPPLMTLQRRTDGEIVVQIQPAAGPDYARHNGQKIRLPKRINERPAI